MFLAVKLSSQDLGVIVLLIIGVKFYSIIRCPARTGSTALTGSFLAVSLNVVVESKPLSVKRCRAYPLSTNGT